MNRVSLNEQYTQIVELQRKAQEHREELILFQKVHSNEKIKELPSCHQDEIWYFLHDSHRGNQRSFTMEENMHREQK